jgi:restriction system protein
LDLLPKWPNQAIEVAESYFLAHMMVMPDGRMHGIADVQAIIRAKWIGNPQDISGKKTLLVKLGSRRFEHLIDELYASMGYETRLTAPTRDGGRDVIASMSSPAQAVRILVECKLTTRPVGIQVLRQVLGAVAHEIANKGAIVTNAKFTTPSSKLADSDPRLELVDGDRLIPLLNQYLGANWPSHVDVHIARSLSRYSAAK